MQTAILQTETVDIYCFATNYAHLHQHIHHIHNQLPRSTKDKLIKVVLFVQGLTLQHYSDTQQSLKNTYKQLFNTYSVNLLMLGSIQQFKPMVEQIRTANGQQYQSNYLQLQKISEKTLKNKVLQRYLQKKFKWSQVKANYFIDRHKVNSLADVLKYEGYPQWQKTLVGKTIAFHQFCGKHNMQQQQI